MSRPDSLKPIIEAHAAAQRVAKYKRHASTVELMSTYLQGASKASLVDLALGRRSATTMELLGLGLVWLGSNSAHITPFGEAVAHLIIEREGFEPKRHRLRVIDGAAS